MPHRRSAAAQLFSLGHMTLPEDIIAKVQRDFTADDAIVILQLLSELKTSDYLGWYHCDRLLRCAIFVASGSYDKFAAAVATDPRDLIMAAEYDRISGKRIQKRDMNLPFTTYVA